MLKTLLGNGVGGWFTNCYWCKSPSPAINGRDELRILAAAKARGWHCERGADARYTLACASCYRVRGCVPTAA